MNRGMRMKETSHVLICLPDLIKVSDDLVQEPQAFQALLVDIALRVKFFEIWHRGEHHTHTVIRLVVKVLSGEKPNNIKFGLTRRSVRLLGL